MRSRRNARSCNENDGCPTSGAVVPVGRIQPDSGGFEGSAGYTVYDGFCYSFLEVTIMTLRRWVRRFGAVVADCSGCRVVYVDRGCNGFAELYDLRDFAVSTVGGGCVYLTPR